MRATDVVSVDILKTSDLIIWQRQYAPESLVINRQLRKMGIPTIFHCDDNVWEIPPGNPAKSSYMPGSPEINRFELLMSSCDAVTTSTPYLKELCSRFNRNVHILRNLVEPKIADFKHPGRDNPEEVRIGWTGTPHHFDDIRIIEWSIKELWNLYKNVKFVFMGFSPVDKSILLNNINRWEYYEFVPVDAFYPSLANLDFDIGLAPLEDNRFNKAKTGRKAQEYAVLSIPMVLAPLSPYKDWVHGENCLKPKGNQPMEWVKDIKWMIDHPKERTVMAAKAHEQLIRNHDINKFIHERAATYIDIYAKAKGRKED
jgi:hypothetical protein